MAIRNSPVILTWRAACAAWVPGMVIATGIELARVMTSSPLGVAGYLTVFVLAFITVALLRWPLVAVLFGLGSMACFVTYRRLRP